MLEAVGTNTRDFCRKVMAWAITCFGTRLSYDPSERNQRFLEEALELVQSTNLTRDAAHQLVDYVYDRPVGDPKQEVAGTMISLAALCAAHKIDIDEVTYDEMVRITDPEVVQKVRAKQALKPRFGEAEVGMQAHTHPNGEMDITSFNLIHPSNEERN